MIINNKAASGFKFSFNNKQTSAKSTPKFTSIEFEKDTFTRMHSQLKNSRQYKTDKKKLESLLVFHEASKPHLKILRQNSSQKSIQVKRQIQDNRKQGEMNKQSHSSVVFSVDNKKLILLNKPKKVQIFEKQSIQKLVRKQKKDYESLSLEDNEFFQPNLLQKGEGLKSERKYLINSQKNLNWSFKKNINILQPIQKRDQSPKSAHSFREPPKALKKFFPPPPEPEFIESVTAPQTEKSKKFMQESQNPSFFRRNETKKNIGGSKVLFKTQKANLNLRLNNISGVSRLNIQID